MKSRRRSGPPGRAGRRPRRSSSRPRPSEIPAPSSAGWPPASWEENGPWGPGGFCWKDSGWRRTPLCAWLSSQRLAGWELSRPGPLSGASRPPTGMMNCEPSLSRISGAWRGTRLSSAPRSHLPHPASVSPPGSPWQGIPPPARHPMWARPSPARGMSAYAGCSPRLSGSAPPVLKVNGPGGCVPFSTTATSWSRWERAGRFATCRVRVALRR